MLCVLLGSISQRIFKFSSQNLDNCRVFSMISLQFSFINIFISFSGYVQFHSNSSEISQRKKGGREREFALKDCSLTNSLGYFDVTLTWFLSGYVLRGI